MKEHILKEYFSIPNLMGYFRILLIPVYLFLYIRAETTEEYYMAAIVLLISFLTDLFDGKIARRFHMVTEFGKILDPVADKLTQGAMAISFSCKYPAMGLLLFVFLGKECLMALLGLYMMKKNYRMNGAQKHGKVCTAVLDLVMILVLVLPGMSIMMVNILVEIAVIVMLVSLALYLNMYRKAWKSIIDESFKKEAGHVSTENVPEEEKKKRKQERTVREEEEGESSKKGRRGCMWKIALAVFMIAVIAAVVLLPYLKQPEIAEETKRNFNAEKFYGDSASGERAKIISDNGEALEERIRMISQAKEEIILSSYAMEADISGKQVLSALLAAADRGVKVSIVTDGVPYVTAIWGNPYFLALAGQENVEMKIYNPLRFWQPWKLMGRLHDKYLIVDRSMYILGGRNTYDFFLGDQPGYKNYDWDMLVCVPEGSKDTSLEQVRAYFSSVWKLSDCKIYGKSPIWKWNPSVKAAEEELRGRYKEIAKEHPDWITEKDYTEETVEVKKMTLLSNPIHVYAKEPVVYYEMTELMKQADREVLFHTPYIICNDWMTEQLAEVCEGEKEVRMMTNSVANNGNPFGAMDYQRNRGKIIDTGVRIMEYDGGVSYHGKCFTIDGRLTGIGSFNWDMRSAYLDTELMLVADSEELTGQMNRAMEKYEEKALKVIDEHHYDLKEGQKPRDLSDKKAFRIKVLDLFASWARFLM